MSQAIVIAAPRHQDPRKVFDVASLPPWNLAKTHMETHPVRISLQAQDLSWYITISEMQDPDDIALDYMTNEGIDEAFRAEVATKKFLLLSYNDYQVMRSFLLAALSNVEAEIREYWLDNDYGVIFNCEDFLDKLRLEPMWDWRVGADVQ